MTPAEIAATRQLIGFTIADLAANLKVNERTVRGWESGKYEPRPEIVEEIKSLRSFHDYAAHRMIEAANDGVPIEIEQGSRRDLSLAARVLAVVPDANLAWL